MVTLPFESAEVMGTGIATGVVGRVVASCVFDVTASVELKSSSGSVDVEVFVRYSAVEITSAGDAQLATASQLQTPRPGKKSWIILVPHASSPKATKVQPLGSSIVLTPLVCTPSGMRGCDGYTATAPVGAIEHVGVPLMVVDRVPVHDMPVA